MTYSNWLCNTPYLQYIVTLGWWGINPISTLFLLQQPTNPTPFFCFAIILPTLFLSLILNPKNLLLPSLCLSALLSNKKKPGGKIKGKHEYCDINIKFSVNFTGEEKETENACLGKNEFLNGFPHMLQAWCDQVLKWVCRPACILIGWWSETDAGRLSYRGVHFTTAWKLY